MKKLLLSTLAVLTLGTAIQTTAVAGAANNAKQAEFIIGQELVVTACAFSGMLTQNNTKLYTSKGVAVCVAAVDAAKKAKDSANKAEQ